MPRPQALSAALTELRRLIDREHFEEVCLRVTAESFVVVAERGAARWERAFKFREFTS